MRPERVAARANSLHCILDLARQGLGATLLPCFLGDRTSDLARIGNPLPELDAGLWMLTHSDLRRSARVRAFMDFAGAELTRSTAARSRVRKPPCRRDRSSGASVSRSRPKSTRTSCENNRENNRGNYSGA